MTNSRSNSTISAADIFGAVERVNSTVNQGTASSIAQTRQSESNVIRHVDTTAERIFAGQSNLNSTINQGTATTVAQVRRSEANLSQQISKLAAPVWETMDTLIVVLATLVGGLVGWWFSHVMIAHEFAAWVDRKETTELVKDAVGNLVSINTTATTETVWFTVWVTVVIFAAFFGLLAFLFAGSRTKKGRE